MQVTNGTTNYRLVLSPMTGNRLPKRAASVQIVVDGTPTTAPVTSNASWAADGKTLEYIWIVIDGKAYYLTLDYDQKASELTGTEFTTSEGTAARVDPARITKDAAKEAARIAGFKTTWAARSAA